MTGGMLGGVEQQADDGGWQLLSPHRAHIEKTILRRRSNLHQRAVDSPFQFCDQ